MKRTLLIIALALFTLTAKADEYFTGAYWTLKAPLPVSREAGQVNVTVRDDHTVTMDTFYNGSSSMTATGTWSAVKGKIVINAKADLGNTGLFPNAAFFYGKATSGLAVGTYRIYYAGELYTGKWQATHP